MEDFELLALELDSASGALVAKVEKLYGKVHDFKPELDRLKVVHRKIMDLKLAPVEGAD